MSQILDKIVRQKRLEISAAKGRRSLDQVQRDAASAPTPRGFCAALRRATEIGLIAEVKKASPSKGLIRADFDPPTIARTYEAHGAHCISVLTDESFFQGHLDYLTQVRAATRLPILRKDFILDPYQVYEARAAGADAILLIAECLDIPTLNELYQLARSLSMDALVELYEPENLQAVIDCGTELIGVNNRNLQTFQVDLQHSIRLRAQVPPDRIFVSESGIDSRTDVQQLLAANVNAMLVGEAIMKHTDMGPKIDHLLGNP